MMETQTVPAVPRRRPAKQQPQEGLVQPVQPVKPMKPKKVAKKVEFAEPIVVAAAEPEPVMEPEPVIEAIAELVELVEEKRRVSKFQKNYTSLVDKVNDLLTLIQKENSARQTRFLTHMEKRVVAVQHGLTKLNRKKGKETEETAEGDPSKRTRSGLQKPVEISEELARFAGWDVCQPYSRVSVTKMICEYIKTHNLRSEKDGRYINPDRPLADLLQYVPGEGKELTYAKLQTYLSRHFPKRQPEPSQAQVSA